MYNVFKMTAFLLIATILSFELFHLDIHTHQTVEIDQSINIHFSELENIGQAHDGHDSEHGHLVLFRISDQGYKAKISEIFNLFGLDKVVTNVFPQKNLRSLIYEKSFIENHRFIYKNPFQFRNKTLII